MTYLFVKWLHIIAIISWMAGILYLYRLFIYHAEKGAEPKIHELLVTMEHRLYSVITMPAMLVSFGAGIALVVLNPSTLTGGGWLHAKFLLVLALAGMTGYAKKLHKKFKAQDDDAPSGKRLRFLNEVPTILMIIIVGLVVFKPF